MWRLKNTRDMKKIREFIIGLLGSLSIILFLCKECDGYDWLKVLIVTKSMALLFGYVSVRLYVLWSKSGKIEKDIA